MNEFGIFSTEGLIDQGFYSIAEAQPYADALVADGEEGVSIELLCPDHEEQADASCSDCNADINE